MGTLVKNPNIKTWVIEYLPKDDMFGGENKWTFIGTKEELNKHLNENFSCVCEDCVGKDWWESNISSEFIVEEDYEGRE